MRVVVLGGAGNFGARIVRALSREAAIDAVVPRREQLDVRGDAFEAQLRALAPDLVVHCAGPFQGQDYRVARAALAARAHYLDLADGRDFVAGFASELDEQAIASDRTAIAGASTLPALSSAVVEALSDRLTALESIEVVIAPGQRAQRGRATLAAVFSYLGRPFPIWRQGRWQRAWGWMDLRATRLDIGRRLAAVCDVPDLALFPKHFVGVRTVCFHAALEFRVHHLALWTLASLIRMGLPLRVERWAAQLDRAASLFDAVAGEQGGMSVCIVGTRGTARVRRTWLLRTPAVDGPEIPCMPAILIARQLAAGKTFARGAFPCIGLLTLADFAPEFARWGITTRIVEEDA